MWLKTMMKINHDNLSDIKFMLWWWNVCKQQ